MIASWSMHLHQASFHAAGEARTASIRCFSLASLALSAKARPDWDGLPRTWRPHLCYQEPLVQK